MSQSRRCEECLAAPGPDGTCTKHPYARLVLVDDAQADEERTLRRQLRWARPKGMLLLLAAALAVAALALLPGAVSGLLVALTALLLALVPFALLWPAAAFIQTALRQRGGWQPRWPPWAWAALGGLAWAGLAAAALIAELTQGDIARSIRVAMLYAALWGPLVLAWGTAAVLIVASRLRGSPYATEEDAEGDEEPERAKDRQAARAKQPLG